MIPYFNPTQRTVYLDSLLGRIEDYMETMTWQKTLTRPAVSGFSHYSSGVKRGNPCHSMVFGVTRRFGSCLQEAANNYRHPRLYSMLLQLKDSLPNGTSLNGITINKNLECLPHTDGNDPGSNAIIVGLGDYTGGQLGIRGDNGNVYEFDIHRKFLHFNGNKLEHWTLPFTGTRYTIVFYKKKTFTIDP